MSEPNREPIPLREPIFIKRYTVAARVHHWFTAVTAILLALSGFAFFGDVPADVEIGGQALGLEPVGSGC